MLVFVVDLDNRPCENQPTRCLQGNPSCFMVWAIMYLVNIFFILLILNMVHL